MLKNKSLFGVITDTHLKPSNIELVKAIYRQFIAYLQKHGIKKAVLIGDAFTTRSSQSLECLLAWKEILGMFSDAGITFCSIPGNHDKVDLNSEDSYLDIFKSDGYANWSDYISMPYAKDVRVHFLPYFKEGEAYISRLREAAIIAKESHGKNILLTHISVNGVRNNDGSLVDGEIEANLFNCFDVVLVGHYHDRQKVGKNIHYIGSAYQANFGEDTEKGFVIVNEDATLDYHKTIFPVYRKIKVDATDRKAMQAAIDLKKNNPNDNVRVIVTGTKDVVESVDVSLLKQAGIDVKKEGVVERVEFVELEDAPPIVFDKKAVLKGWTEYAKEQNFTKEARAKGISHISKLEFKNN